MDTTIINRTILLRNKIEAIKSNRKRYELLKNYYKGKTAIVIATGPGLQEYIDLIRTNINENTIVICIKQSLRCFDHFADFHILNLDNYEEYSYDNPKPITILLNYPTRVPKNTGDINFFINNIPGVNHNRVNNWHSVNNNIDSLSFNDANYGPGENMVFNGKHIMMEIVFPLCIHLGVKNIITNGWVGGSNHGVQIKNEIDYFQKYPHLVAEQDLFIEISKKLPVYFKEHFGINIYTICDSKYHIQKIDDSKYVEIINS